MSTKFLGFGAGLCVGSAIPDKDVFCGRGGKDVIPLYRDAAGTEPNVTGGLLDALGKAYGATPTAEDLAAYVYAVLGGQSYTRRFWNELETPGPRVPLTKDAAIFSEAAKLGRKLIWLHTYAERFRSKDRDDEIPPGTAKIIKGVSDNPAKYPEASSYSPATHDHRGRWPVWPRRARGLGVRGVGPQGRAVVDRLPDGEAGGKEILAPR